MAPEKAPAFQAYPRDFVGDLDVGALDLEQVGFYWLLLCYAWLKDGLPDDFPKISRALRISTAKFQKLWAVVGEKFYRDDVGKWRNARQEEEREKQRKYREERSSAGRKGNAQRHHSDGSATAERPLSDRRAVAKRRSSSSSSSSSSSTQPSVEGTGALAPSPSPSDLANLWNETTTRLPKCLKVSGDRERSARSRLREEPNLETWRAAIVRLNASDFAAGQNDRGWSATFDFLLQPGTLTKVMEGKYDNRAGPVPMMGAGRTAGNVAALEAVLNRKRVANVE